MRLISAWPSEISSNFYWRSVAAGSHIFDNCRRRWRTAMWRERSSGRCAKTRRLPKRSRYSIATGSSVSICSIQLWTPSAMPTTNFSHQINNSLCDACANPFVILYLKHFRKITEDQFESDVQPEQRVYLIAIAGASTAWCPEFHVVQIRSSQPDQHCWVGLAPKCRWTFSCKHEKKVFFGV